MSTHSEIESLMLLLEDPDPFVQDRSNRFMDWDRATILDQLRVETKDKKKKTSERCNL